MDIGTEDEDDWLDKELYEYNKASYKQIVLHNKA